MEENHANHYTREVMPILIREFQSPDEEMKKIVLKVIQQCCGTSGVSAEYVKESVLPEFFKAFWIRRMALDRRNYKQVVETTEELANKCGAVEIISRIVDDLKDDSELYRRMVMEAITKIVDNLGLGEVDQRLEERLIDGVLYAFQEQSVDADIKDNMVMLDGFGQVVKALGTRCKPYVEERAGDAMARKVLLLPIRRCCWCPSFLARSLLSPPPNDAVARMALLLSSFLARSRRAGGARGGGAAAAGGGGGRGGGAAGGGGGAPQAGLARFAAHLGVLLAQVLVEDHAEVAHELVLAARLHHDRDLADQVGRLHADRRGLVVEAPLDGARDLLQVPAGGVGGEGGSGGGRASAK
jgi:uncharacterized membrane protein YgcG